MSNIEFLHAFRRDKRNGRPSENYIGMDEMRSRAGGLGHVVHKKQPQTTLELRIKMRCIM